MFTRFCRCGFGVCLAVAVLILPALASAQPVLSVSPESVNLMAYQGSNAPQQSVEVRNAGNRALKWSASQPANSWLTLMQTNGVNSGSIGLKFLTSGLTVGTHQTSFVVTGNGSTRTVPVVLTVVAAPVQATKLVVSCPANMTVASPNGSSVAVTYSPTVSGGAAPVTMTASPPSGSSFEVGTRLVSVGAQSADQQTASCSFSVTVTYTPAPPPPPTLTVSCPANMSVPSSNGSPVPVTYSATASGGLAPVTVTLSPVSSSLFAVGSTFVTATARSSDSQTASCAFSVTVTYTAPPPPPPPPPASAVGPQSTITCPAGAVDIWPGTAIQGVVNIYPGNTTFCLRAGIHSLRSSITPKTGDIFVGEYGAILDGTGWSTSDDTQAAFRAHNQDIDYVTIRNLVIRKMPFSGIHAFYWMSDHWTIEYNEIASNKMGLEVAPNFTIRNNYIHHNVGNTSSSNPAERGGGYLVVRADNTTFDSNEIAYNGPEQKVGMSTNVTFRNNFVHHNVYAGIWYDTNTNGGTLIEGNRVEDNGQIGIALEASIGATIRNNTVRRHSASEGVFLSMSQNAQIYSNTLEANFGGIAYFLNCDSLSLGEDVKNNAAYDNTVVVGTQSYAYASGFSYLSSCTSTQVAPYLNGSKNLTFSRNAYSVPSLSAGSFDRYFLWPGWKYWTEWQALGQDVAGSLSK